MVRKAIVKDLCDKCLDDTGGDDEREAEYCMVIQLNEGGTIEIDLCMDHCNGMNVLEMIAAARDTNTQEYKPKKTRQKVKCQWCGKYYSLGSGMALHQKNAHPDQYNAHKVVVIDDPRK